MGKFKCSTKCSRARSKARNFGHYKTSFGGKHVRVTVGTKGIHSSIKMGPVTYKPGSGRYSVKTPIKGVTYYGKTQSHKSYGHYSSSVDSWDEIKDAILMSIAAVGMTIVFVGMTLFEEQCKEGISIVIEYIFRMIGLL